MGVCRVVGAGECENLNFCKCENDLIIAADGGYRYLINAGINPDIIIGDFDSLGLIPEGDNIVRLNPVKDITDMQAAVDEGIKRGYTEFHLYGACGGRIDHTLANIQLIANLAQKNISAFIHSDVIITAICNSTLRFDDNCSGYISVFSHSDKSEDVSIKGLKYNLDNAELSNSFPLGISNEFVGKKSEISVKNGVLIVVYALKYN